MKDIQKLIKRAYSAFNERDVEGALILMSAGVDWPKASEGGRAIGKDAIRAYWTHQWSEFDPHVEPVEIVDAADGKTHVRVHQLVKSLAGEVLFEGEVWHVYTLVDGLIERMDLLDSEASSADAPTAAFASR